MASVSLNNISKVFPGNIWAIDGLNLEIADGEFLVLVGPSGCGKTTLLRIVAGLEQVTKGAVQIGGRFVDNVPPRDRNVAMVFQDRSLYPHLTVFDNLAFGLRQREDFAKRPQLTTRPEFTSKTGFWTRLQLNKRFRFKKNRHQREQIEAIVYGTAERLGIVDLLGRRPGELSGGQQQRVALGRAIARRPDVYLLDEPLSNLDANMRSQLRVEIKQLHRTLRQTTIYVTHDQTEAMTLGDRIVVLCNGAIQQIASPQELYDNPSNTFVASFIGTPAMNLFTGILQPKDDQLVLQMDGCEISLPDQPSDVVAESAGEKVVLGIRPEDVAATKGEFANDSFTNDKKSTMCGMIEMIERTGPEAYLYASHGALRVTSRIGIEHDFGVGEEVNLVFDLSRIHLFNAATGMRLLPDATENVATQ